uniref:PD-(D/E)XK endonuclease-like domain-containing protein n=1 Tax=viral metagenome TaxID=1070528 RepID=A0A6C0DGQ4_9ZZZZ
MTVRLRNMPYESWQILSRRNVHERDQYITFDEPTHTYTVKGTYKGYISVTKIIHGLFPEFDAVKVIRQMRAKPDFDKGEYAGMTDRQIMAKWKEGSQAGTNLHLAIEQFLNEAPQLINPEILKTVEWTYFMRFWDKYKDQITPYRLEWEVWIEELKLAGSIDGVFKKTDGTYAIYDWKRSKDIKMENRYQSGFGPIAHLPHTNYWHYTIQLNIYRWILERYYGLVISEMFLVILHPNFKSFRRIEVNRLDEETDEIMELRRKGVEGGSVVPVLVEEEGCQIRL